MGPRGHVRPVEGVEIFPPCQWGPGPARLRDGADRAVGGGSDHGRPGGTPQPPCRRATRVGADRRAHVEGVLAEGDPDSGNLARGSLTSAGLEDTSIPPFRGRTMKRARHPVSREHAACLVRPTRGLTGAFARSKRRDGVRPAAARGTATGGGDKPGMCARHGQSSGLACGGGAGDGGARRLGRVASILAPDPSPASSRSSRASRSFSSTSGSAPSWSAAPPFASIPGRGSSPFPGWAAPRR